MLGIKKRDTKQVFKAIAHQQGVSVSRPGTFSRRKYAGRLSATSLATSKKRVPLASANPSLRPAIENAWQGNPAHKRSKSGIRSVSIFLASLQNHSPSVSNSTPVVVVCICICFTVSDTGEAPCPVQPFSESSDSTEQVKKSNCSGYQPPFAAKKTVQISLHRFRLLVSVL